MEFTIENVYDQKAVTAMAKALRKTIRKKRNRCVRIFGWIVVALAVLLSIPMGGEKFVLSFRTVITWIAGIMVLISLLFEDRINGYVARKRMLKGTERGSVVFREEGYNSSSEIGKSEWFYDKISLIIEIGDYFVFAFDQSHAQVFLKAAISGGTVDEFREFICRKTGKEVLHVK